MNIFKAELDTIHQNGVIGPITQFDNATLELQILSDGQVGEPWNSPQFELIAMKRDMNPVREIEQDKFTILSKEEHRVRIELKEQFLTCRGTVKMQLIVKDGSRSSTTIFRLSVGQSLDHDIITSIRDVEVLDQLDLYVEQGFRAIDEATEITGELKKEMTEINNEASECEKERQASELTRNQRELVRVANEEDRVANELERIQNEEMRVANEEERVENENTRIANENNRRTHENTRITQEVARQEAERQRNAIFEENENIRSEQENTRIKSENERKKKFSAWEERETVRLKSEENRILQERERVSDEDERKRQELTRQNQEEYRQRTYTQFNEAEASRVNNEIQRAASEKQRQQAETNRDAAYQRREENRDVEYGKAEEVRNAAFEQNEANRQNEYTAAERERVESEELRKGRERDRANAETKRQEAETARANAESGRVDRFNKEIEKAKTTMATATSNVNTAISQADATMQGIEQRAEGCLPAIEKSASAKLDYMGNEHDSIKDAMDANVEFVLDEVNTVHYEGQTITATDTIERQVRSAILKGCTLVNAKPKTNLSKWGMSSYDSDSGICTISGTNSGIRFSADLLKPSTKYLVMFEIIELPSFAVESDDPIKLTLGHDSYNYVNINRSELKVGTLRKIVTTANEFTGILTIGNRGDFSNPIKLRFMIFEYVEGMENWDIPYFEGMKSVRMPVLSTCGKNLSGKINKNATFAWVKSYEWENDILKLTLNGGGFNAVRFHTKLPKGTYYLSASHSGNAIGFRVVDDNGSKLVNPITITKDEEVLVEFMGNGSNVEENKVVEFSNIQLEEGSIATTYEPPKTNILIINEEIELGSVGNVQDTLDLMTGEVVEKTHTLSIPKGLPWKVNELNETNWEFATDIYYDNKITPTPLNTSTNSKGLIADTMFDGAARVSIADYSPNKDRISLYIRYNPQNVPSHALTLDSFRAYVDTKTHILRYQTKESAIKTVDLKGQKLYSYDGTTHYTCSAADGSLVPTLSIDVPTRRLLGETLQIQVNETHIQVKYSSQQDWTDLIALERLKGLQGPQGEPGPKGDPGEQGIQGQTGKDGVNGKDGKDGITPNLTIGTVTTLEPGQEATVTIRGTKENPTLDIAIPRGPAGKDGVNGKDGKDGITPNLTIGTVTTLEPGQEATVTIRGTKENPILDIAIPRGPAGKDGESLVIKDELVATPIIDATLTLTTDKYQTSVMADNTTIVLPNVNSFTEIHLFFNTISELTLTLPNIKWQTQPTIEANKMYEFIFTYTTEWVGGVICYN